MAATGFRPSAHCVQQGLVQFGVTGANVETLIRNLSGAPLLTGVTDSGSSLAVGSAGPAIDIIIEQVLRHHAITPPVTGSSVMIGNNAELARTSHGWLLTSDPLLAVEWVKGEPAFHTSQLASDLLPDAVAYVALDGAHSCHPDWALVN